MRLVRLDVYGRRGLCQVARDRFLQPVAQSVGFAHADVPRQQQVKLDEARGTGFARAQRMKTRPRRQSCPGILKLPPGRPARPLPPASPASKSARSTSSNENCVSPNCLPQSGGGWKSCPG